MPRFVTCGPNEAIIVSGCCHSTPTIRAGGRVFVWPIFHRIQRISLNTITVNVESQKVYSGGGVPVTLKGVAQVKIQGQDLTSLRQASEMFLDKTEDEIRDIAQATLDGHQRSIIASTKIEDIYGSKQFSISVQQSAQADLIDMGLTLVSYTVQSISDDEGYLDALGQDKTIAVRCEARKEIAKAKSCSDKEKIATEQEKKENELKHQQSVALKQLDFEIAKASYLKEHFENKARSEKAGDLQAAEMNSLIASEMLAVSKLEKEKENELILKRKELRELELKDTIEKKADFECQREILLAEAYANKAKVEAQLEADRIKATAQAKAEIMKEKYEAQAAVVRERAQAYMQFGTATKLEMVLEILPRLTAEIAGPIAECNKITSVSQDGSVGFVRITNEIMEVVSQICDAVSNITGQSIARDGIGNDNTSGNNNDTPAIGARKSSTESSFGTGQLADRQRLFNSSMFRSGRP